MAAHSTAWGAGCAHRQLPGVRRPRAPMACQPNQAAAVANTACQMVPGTGLSCGSSIPAMATPMRTCSTSASGSVGRPRSLQMTSRAVQLAATSSMSAASPPASHARPVTSASFHRGSTANGGGRRASFVRHGAERFAAWR